ncbi:kelch-like protein 10 [Mugil cephalus]|uniref:kelch-like protein 10 n=1 Tax=Mugil cephalus TaxID=48193 RepID=UPI001FB760A6|nr:kelch-like protein 10 [Mugil cephalus]
MNKQGRTSQKPSSVFNELRLERRFCDAVIKVQDVEFQIHKIILANCTPYFQALFTRWSDHSQKVFIIPGLSPDMMELIIEFAYTGSVTVTEANAQELMLAAEQLNVAAVAQTCCDFFVENLCPGNCIGIWKFTNICASPELQLRAFCYVIDHFEEVVPCEEFLQLSAQELNDILGRDNLNVQKESTVYEAMLRWIQHEPRERELYIVALLSKVRLGLLSAEYISTNILSIELVKNNPECLRMFADATKIIFVLTSDSTVTRLCNPFSRPRLPNSILLAIGGWSGGDPTNGMEAYDVRADRWINVTNSLEPPRAYHGAAFLNGYVYCVGGFDRVEHFSSTRRFDLNTRTWGEVAPMHYRRCYVSVAVLHGCIYALGGYNGHARLSTAEYYRPEINQWSLIAPMHEQRSDSSCTTLHNKIYICGGFNGNECLQTAECYNPATNQWTMIPLMNSRRSGLGVIAYANQVYAVGGFDGTNRLRSVEAYNLHTNTWNNVTPMVTPRSNFGIEVLEGRLFAVGGFNGVTTTYDVECYEATADQWTEVCDMDIYRSALSCCVVSGIPNLSEYAAPRDDVLLQHVLGEEEEEEEGDGELLASV